MAGGLTAEQKNILLSMAANVNLAADLARAYVTIYVPDDNPKFLQVYACGEPVTRLVWQQKNNQGRQVRLREEPLLTRALQRNLTVSGLREYVLGQFAYLKVYPVCDTHNRCFALVSLEMMDEPAAFAEAAVVFLLSSSRSYEGNICYRRLSSIDGLILVDAQTLITAANNTARHIFHVLGVAKLIGRRTSSFAINWPLVGSALETGEAVEREMSVQGLDLKVRVLPLVPRPHAPGAIVVVEDVTELKKKDEQLLVKSVVIKEIHHRVKNNLQTIASLLRLQERRAQCSETRQVLRDCINRVNSIAVVHEFLSQQDSGVIDIAEAARGIYDAIMSSMVAPNLRLRTKFTADAVSLPSEQATSVALILNELLQNSLEHGFENRDTGNLEVRFIVQDDHYELCVEDDGWGLPVDFEPEHTKSLGLKIIKIMVESDLKGRFILENRPAGGTRACVYVPRKPAEQETC